MLFIILLNSILCFNFLFIKPVNAYNLQFHILSHNITNACDKVTLKWYMPEMGSVAVEYAVIEMEKDGGGFNYKTTVTGAGWRTTVISIEDHGVYRFRIQAWYKVNTPVGGSGGYICYEWIYNFIDTADSPTVEVYRAVDVQIMYDKSFLDHFADMKGWGPSEMYHIADDVSYALNYGFGQYWKVRFHTGYSAPWLIYDDDGYKYSSTATSLSSYWGWRNDPKIQFDKKWDDYPSLVHGNKFDILMMFIKDSRFNPGVTKSVHWNWTIINLWGQSWYEWDNRLFIGARSTMMHEMGHAFQIDGRGNEGYDFSGLTNMDARGDTWLLRNSVMDYFWSQTGFGMIFDSGHHRVIGSSISSGFHQK